MVLGFSSIEALDVLQTGDISIRICLIHNFIVVADGVEIAELKVSLSNKAACHAS